jgi:menaquinone-dependent protoporphyrinogen oxidase
MPVQTLSRRKFLKVTGLTIGGGVLACSGLTALGLYRPSVTLPETTLGDQSAAKRILIAYASICGSTAEVAAEIGRVFAQHGVEVDVMPVDKVTDLTGYQAVVVGSAVRMAKWMKSAVNFVSENLTTLQGVPTAFFTVCMTMADDSPANLTKSEGFSKSIRAMLAPAVEGYFAGKVDFKRLSFIEGNLLKAKGGIAGDFRNWEKIRDWAQTTCGSIFP